MLPRTPRTDPGVRHSRTGLPPGVTDGKAAVGPGRGEAGSWERAILRLGHRRPRRCVLLAAPAKRAPPQVGEVVAEVPERAGIGRDRAVGVEAPRDLPQPGALLVDRLMHPAAQRLLDRPQRAAHPVAARLPLELEVAAPAPSADVDEA